MNFVEPSESSWQEFTIEGGANGWYRGEVCNRFPEDRAHEGEYDLDQVIKCVVGGWAPKSPFLTRKDMVTALGSCFAYEVERNLRQAGYRTSLASYGEYTEDSKAKIWEHSLLIKCSEGHVNTASIRTQFEWVYDESLAPLKIWKKVDGVIKEYLDNNREVAKLIFSETTCFIITLGLSEVWYNKVTQEVLWTSVHKAQFDKDIYGFRLLTVQENLENLKRTVAIIRQHKGNIPIVFTLSPIPLAATFRPIPAISATSVSVPRCFEWVASGQNRAIRECRNRFPVPPGRAVPPGSGSGSSLPLLAHVSILEPGRLLLLSSASGEPPWHPIQSIPTTLRTMRPFFNSWCLPGSGRISVRWPSC